MFERPHHRRIAAALEALDAEVLATNVCLFGGGTAVALRYGEYRESVDIAFLVSRVEGYRHLRQRLTGPDGIRAITRAGHALSQTREVRADQYGIRTMLKVDGADTRPEAPTVTAWPPTWPARWRTCVPGRIDWIGACRQWP